MLDVVWGYLYVPCPGILQQKAETEVAAVTTEWRQAWRIQALFELNVGK